MVTRYQRIIVDVPFRPVSGHDQHQVSATLEAASGTRRLLLTIPGQRRPAKGTSSEDAWQDAMGFLTLLELERWNFDDLPAEDGAEQILHLLEEVKPKEWEGVGGEAFVQQRLFDYMVSRTATGWQTAALPEMEAIREVIQADPNNVVPIFTVRCHSGDCNLPIYVLYDDSRGSQPFPHDAFVITCPSCHRRDRYGRGEVYRT